MQLRPYLFAIAWFLAACGSDPVGYSEPVGINLKAKSADTQNGVVTDEKGITTETGNPYGTFVADARADLGDVDPSVIDVAEVQVFLGAGSVGVTTLGEIFDGELDIVFQVNDTNNSYPVAAAQITAATDAGPITLATSFDAGAVSEIDFGKLLTGSFKVIARGPAAPDFTTKGADADVQVTTTFKAYP